MDIIMVKTTKIVYEEIVMEVELEDVACPSAAPHAIPLAAVLASPGSQSSARVACDASFEGEERIPLGRDAAAI